MFPSLTVFENMCAAAAIARGDRTASFARVLAPLEIARRPSGRGRRGHRAVPASRAYRDARGATLPQGVRKLLDIAMAVAGSPRVLLLDEPTSGISIEEKFGLMDVVMSALKTPQDRPCCSSSTTWRSSARFADRVLAFYDGTVIADEHAGGRAGQSAGCRPSSAAPSRAVEGHSHA